MNYSAMNLDQFLKLRKLKVGAGAGEGEISENEKMYWEYNELMKNIYESDYYFSNENKFLLREGRQLRMKEIHMACLDVCDTPSAQLEVLSFNEGLCLRNCFGKFQNWMRAQYRTYRDNSLGKFIIDEMNEKRRAELGYKPREELQTRAEELKQKIDWEEVNKHIY